MTGTDDDPRPSCRYCGEPIDHDDYGEQQSRAHLPCRPPWRGNPGDTIMPADTSK